VGSTYREEKKAATGNKVLGGGCEVLPTTVILGGRSSETWARKYRELALSANLRERDLWTRARLLAKRQDLLRSCEMT